jgi:hypothetical protein
MAEIVNLRQARKRKRRDDKAKDAAASRLLHGQTAGEKLRNRLDKELGEKRLQGHVRDRPIDDDHDGQT